jgi:hypothetical protein
MRESCPPSRGEPPEDAPLSAAPASFALAARGGASVDSSVMADVSLI